MATFTVTRSKWYRGQGGINSALLLNDGQMCCIGFVGQQCGVADDAMWNISTINGTGQHVNGNWPEWFEGGDAGDLDRAYSVNDDACGLYVQNDSQREAELSRLFAKHGDTLLFVD